MGGYNTTQNARDNWIKCPKNDSNKNNMTYSCNLQMAGKVSKHSGVVNKCWLRLRVF